MADLESACRRMTDERKRPLEELEEMTSMCDFHLCHWTAALKLSKLVIISEIPL